MRRALGAYPADGVPGGRRRVTALVATLAAAAVAAALLLPLASGWHGDEHRRFGPPDSSSAPR